MKLTPYAKVLKLGKEAIQEALAPLRALEMKKQAELEIAKIDGKMVEHDSKIQELCSVYPIKFDSLISALDERALLERRKSQFAAIIKEMFPA